MLEEPSDGSVTCLVEGDRAALLLGDDAVAALEAADDAVDGGLEVLEGDDLGGGREGVGVRA